jgi:transcription initiation factor TFIIE subunit alpha
VELGEQKLKEDPVFREILVRISGEHGYQIASELVDKEMTDEELAKRTGIRLNLVRKILYDLYDNRVVGYRRIRDENSGWYVYYWRIEPERALEFFDNNKRLLLQKLQERLEHERNVMFFGCVNGCPKLPFDVAAENDFKCPRCGKHLDHFDNSNVVIALERQVESLRQHLAGS